MKTVTIIKTILLAALVGITAAQLLRIHALEVSSRESDAYTLSLQAGIQQVSTEVKQLNARVEKLEGAGK